MISICGALKGKLKMLQISSKSSRKHALLSMASATAMIWLAPHTFAQDQAGATSSIEFESLSAPLGETLLAISETYGVSVIASEALIEGKTAPAVVSAKTIEQALAMTLRGSDLEAQRQPSGIFVIAEKFPVAAPAPQPTANPARAPAAEDEVRFETPIIVTGTKQNLGLQDTQASVSVVTEELIDEQAIFELSDILLRTANVTQTAGPFAFSIRGVNSGGVGGAGTGRTANIYVDGAPASLNGLSSAFNLWDIDQVEILRGPQSTTQGRNALAGAVIMQSTDPEYQFGAKGRALVGTDNTYQASGVITGPIIEDQVAFRLAADYREQDFETLNGFTNEPEGASDATTIRAKVLMEPNAIPDLRVEVIAQYVDFFSSGDGSGVIRPDAASPEAVGFDPFDRVNFDFRGGVVENENLRLLTDVTYDFTDHWSGQLIATYDDTERFIDNNTGPDLRLEETYTTDARAVFDYDRLNGWIGAYYFKDDLQSNTDQGFDVSLFGGTISPEGTLVLFQQSRSAETENYALYGDVAFQLNDKISLNFGARYDKEEVKDTGFASSFFADVPDGVPCIISVPQLGAGPCDLVFAFSGLAGEDPQGDVSYEAFLPRGGIIYDFDDKKSISFVVQRGYRAGGLYIITDRATNIQEVRDFDAEFLTNYEIAWRSQFMDDRLTFNANAFFSTWTDQQVRVQVPGTIEPEIFNVGESEIYGLEIESTFDIAPNWNVSGSLGLVQTEFTDFPFAVDENGAPVNPTNPTFANLAGNEFGSAPNVTGSLGVAYDDDMGFFGSAYLSFRGNQYSDVTNLPENETDSYAIVNARFGYRKDNWQISAVVDNLFEDKFLRTNVLQEVDPTTGMADVAGIGRNNTSQPRFIGIELEAEF